MCVRGNRINIFSRSRKALTLWWTKESKERQKEREKASLLHVLLSSLIFSGSVFRLWLLSQRATALRRKTSRGVALHSGETRERFCVCVGG